jgi:hypothetical protein
MKKQLALIAALALSGTVHAGVIDTFNGGAAVDLNSAQTGTGVGTATGTYGALARALTSTSSGVTTNVQINTGTNPGVYAHSQSSGVTGTSFIEYTLADLDLTAGFNTALRVTLTAADLNGVITMYASDGTNFASQSITTTAMLFASGLTYPAYGDFLFSSFAGVDFTSINVLRLGVDGSTQAALDASIDQFSTVCSNLGSNGGSNGSTGNCTPVIPPTPGVPEPATLGLLGLGLLGLGMSRRKRA